jgi:hypothetical protein
MPRWTLPAVLSLCLPLATAQGADPWTARLEGGGTVRVDPQTNRPVLIEKGIETQLWDGVHRLEDGSELTVRAGRVIPNEEILRSREPTAEAPEAGGPQAGAPLEGPSPCERLVRRVCGEQGQCRDARGCDPARQLLDMERQEQAAAGEPRRETFTSGKCREALGDLDFFAPCSARGADAPP